MAHSIAEAIQNAERDLDDALSEEEDAGREARRVRDRLEELRRQVKPRRAVGDGRFFEIDGEVYRRVHSQVSDFGGAIGPCLRAQRMRLAAGGLEVADDAEWLQVSGECRVFASADEAREFLIEFEEGG